MNSIWELENELNYGNFNSTAPQVADAFKVEQALKVLTSEVQRLSVVEGQLMTIQAELTTMTTMYDEVLDVIRKMGKDYPEVVLAKPHLFVDKEFAVVTK